ncbi:hypothetical protein AK812_SmicGene24808 [Symbiodinium microadriaticum]|uniref:Uncharacterized protein n=1 Tax=Symbiodinium microadriaticum TaxID=2951 RepID=A0A1Q9DDU8_SYMMI|nr:hypothetical protein AK812_SmicGene24808 [Symbiodinium microadriaticum]
MGRLLLRHGVQMGIERSENNFIMFFKKESPVSLIDVFKTISQHWHLLQEHKTEGLNLPLRAFLFRTLLDDLLTRLEAVSKSPDQPELRIPFLVYNPSTKQLEFREDTAPITLKRMIELIQEMQSCCIVPLSILRFHSAQKLSNPMQGPTRPFLLQAVSRITEAVALYRHLTLLTHSATWQLVGSSLRLEHMGRSALANEMAKLLRAAITECALHTCHMYNMMLLHTWLAFAASSFPTFIMVAGNVAYATLHPAPLPPPMRHREVATLAILLTCCFARFQSVQSTELNEPGWLYRSGGPDARPARPPAD